MINTRSRTDLERDEQASCDQGVVHRLARLHDDPTTPPLSPPEPPARPTCHVNRSFEDFEMPACVPPLDPQEALPCPSPAP